MAPRLRIKEIAEKQNFTQHALADKSGVTEGLLNRYWNNNILRVSLKDLGQIAKALNVETGYLIEDDGV